VLGIDEDASARVREISSRVSSWPGVPGAETGVKAGVQFDADALRRSSPVRVGLKDSEAIARLAGFLSRLLQIMYA